MLGQDFDEEELHPSSCPHMQRPLYRFQQLIQVDIAQEHILASDIDLNHKTHDP